MSIKSFLAPEVIKTFKSKFNTNIQLVSFSGKLRLDMGGLTQSGQVIEKIWSKAFKKLLPPRLEPGKILILGFGTGSAARVIRKKWPRAEIVGVEIDPVVIKIAKQYFGAGKVPKLKIVNKRGEEFVAHTKDRFDLILVDCYLGHQVPPVFESQPFLKSLTRISGHVLINRLFWNDHKQKTLSFLKELNRLFATSTCRTPSNLIIKV